MSLLGVFFCLVFFSDRTGAFLTYSHLSSPLPLQAASTLQQKLESAVSIFGTMVKNDENCGKSLGIYSI